MPTGVLRGPTACCNRARHKPRVLAAYKRLSGFHVTSAQRLDQRHTRVVGQALSPPGEQAPEPTPSAIKLSTLDSRHRRRLLVQFTCGKCGSRSERLVNPDAYKRGTVFVQCKGCEVWHQLVDNMNLIEEYDLREMPLSEAGAVFQSKLHASKGASSESSANTANADGARDSQGAQHGSAQSLQDQVDSLMDSTGADASSTVGMSSTGGVGIDSTGTDVSSTGGMD